MVGKDIEIHFGCLCDPIRIQLEGQGYGLRDEDAERFQRLADAILMVKLNRLFPDGACAAASKKLYRFIVKAAVPLEGLVENRKE